MTKNTELLPCEVNAKVKCAKCHLHNNGCPIEAMCGVIGAYDIVKSFYPVKTTPKAGVNVRELVQTKYPLLYKVLGLGVFDWEKDLDGVLDFLYGEQEIGIMCGLLGIAKSEITELIKYIEGSCEVRCC